MQLLFGRKVGGRTVTSNDREGDDNRSGPRTHLKQIERCPVRQEKDFGRNIGEIFPRVLTQHRQIEFAVRVDSWNASQPHRGRPCSPHLRLFGGKPSQLQAEVTLHRGGHIARSARIDRPTPVG